MRPKTLAISDFQSEPNQCAEGDYSAKHHHESISGDANDIGKLDKEEMVLQGDTKCVPSEPGEKDSSKPFETTPGSTVEEGDPEHSEGKFEEIFFVIVRLRNDPAPGSCGEGSEDRKVERQIKRQCDESSQPGKDRPGNM